MVWLTHKHFRLEEKRKKYACETTKINNLLYLD